MRFVNFWFQLLKKENVSTHLPSVHGASLQSPAGAEHSLGESRRFSNPQKVYVDLSPKLYQVKKELIEEMSRKDLEFEEE